MQADNADYWHCSLCTFHNPAKRSYCEICFATSTDNQPSTVTAVNEHLQPPPLPPLFAQLQDHLQQGCGLVRNTSVFVCPICFDNIAAGDGVVLCECLHEFCRGCLRRTVLISVSSLVRCPVVQADDVQRSLCVGIVVDSEIREILSADEYADHFKRSVHEAEIGEPGSFHCKTPNCAGWCILAKNQVLQPFVCPVCKSVNCVQCKVTNGATGGSRWYSVYQHHNYVICICKI